MADLNHVVLVGRLTRDAELKYTSGGQAVSHISLAVNRRRKNGDQWVEEVSYFDVVLWGQQGESLKQYLLKGKQIGVSGELRQNRWEQDGQTRSKVEVVVNNLQLLGGNPGGGGSGAGAYSGGGRGEGQERSAPPQNESAGDDGFADDIPF